MVKTKVVVRNLPYQFEQSEFETEFKKYLDKEIVDFFYLRRGYVFGTNVFPSIAFLNFKNEEKIFEFAKEYHDFDFIYKKKTFKLNVEYAPFQKVVSDITKGYDDPLMNTIGKDEDFIKFEDNLKKPIVKDLSAELKLEKQEEEERKLIEDGELPNQPLQMTPLVKDILKKRQHGNKKKFAEKKQQNNTNAPNPNPSTASGNSPAKKKKPKKKFNKKDKEQKLKNPSVVADSTGGVKTNQNVVKKQQETKK